MPYVCFYTDWDKFIVIWAEKDITFLLSLKPEYFNSCSVVNKSFHCRFSRKIKLTSGVRICWNIRL